MEAYHSAEMQLVYSIATADWEIWSDGRLPRKMTYQIVSSKENAISWVGSPEKQRILS